ncbi:tRNA threonylcarbamoyladenosine dehydratase, partial [Paenibacillus ihuae]|uniref:tRNA threonylcarbamoyladenosine dehydratase n=1 Tax=Paenibacillus ihuae TaxID=1232431 RepID=UPI001FD7F8B9
RIILIDKDAVDITNINRQIHALTTTIGQKKADLMVERVKLINPEIEAIALNMFYTEETYEELFKLKPDFVIDASDTIIYKIHLIKECLSRGIPMISSMGAANKMDPTRFKVADISKTEMDPIARVIRQKLRKEGIKKGVKVVFSTEIPIKPRVDVTEQIVPADAPDRRKAKQPPASNSFVPPVVGLIMVSVAVNDLLKAGGVSV